MIKAPKEINISIQLHIISIKVNMSNGTDPCRFPAPQSADVVELAGL